MRFFLIGFFSVESEIILTEDNNVQQVGYLKIKKAVLVDKEEEEGEMGEDGGD